MATRALSREEIFGLSLAAIGHVALVWYLAWYQPDAPPLPPQPVSVTLSDEVGPVSTSPNPKADPVADKGPELGEPAPEAPDIAPPQPAPQPIASAAPPPRPAPAVKTPPKPPQQAKAAPAKAPPSKTPPTTRAGASSFNEVFGKGIPGANPKGKDTTPPGAQASAQVVASWSSLIGRKVRGPWNSCTVSGLDADKLRATVRFTLARDGRVEAIEDFAVTGITDANRPQARVFKDCAIRAIRAAAPYTGLPAEYYDQWKQRRLNFSKQ